MSNATHHSGDLSLGSAGAYSFARPGGSISFRRCCFVLFLLALSSAYVDVCIAEVESYDPARDVELLEIEYRVSAGHRSPTWEDSYVVSDDSVRFRESRDFDLISTACGSLTPDQSADLEKHVRRLIRIRWYDVKSFTQLEGDLNYYRFETLRIPYIWNGSVEEIYVQFATNKYGTTRFTIPEVLLIQKLISENIAQGLQPCRPESKIQFPLLECAGGLCAFLRVPPETELAPVGRYCPASLCARQSTLY